MARSHGMSRGFTHRSRAELDTSDWTVGDHVIHMGSHHVQFLKLAEHVLVMQFIHTMITVRKPK